LDTNCNGRVSQELFFKGLRQNIWAAGKLGLEGKSLEDWLEVFHKVSAKLGIHMFAVDGAAMYMYMYNIFRPFVFTESRH